VLAGLVWVMTDFGFKPSDWLALVTWVTAVFAGITMVSNIPFYSFKEVNWRRRVPLWVILASVLGIAVVASRPSLVLFALFMTYSLSGYVMWARERRLRSVLPEE
jgi:CDP-diacylglycerol---serine O-phosphatidyltransferase